MSYQLGVYVWGVVLIAWLISVLVALVRPDSWWSGSLYKHQGLAAATTAVLGVIWSWFLQLDKN